MDYATQPYRSCLIVMLLIGQAGAQPDPPPEPVTPKYTKLKRLHLTTPIVVDGKPSAVIAAPASGIYREPADAIQQVIRELTGAEVPVVDDRDPRARVPFEGHLIALGNRSTNSAINALYDLHYTLLDLKYPGQGGHVVRTLHNPFGNGLNVVLVGGCDTAGVKAAAGALVRRLRAAGSSNRRLEIGWLMDIELGGKPEIPESLSDVAYWNTSAKYGTSGNFGWNLLSKAMALCYMTGEEEYARDVMRLAFPEPQALNGLAKIYGDISRDAIRDPIGKSGHYHMHLMILYWDLIEESPAFSDADRLRMTNAFAKQFEYLGAAGQIYKTTQPNRSYVGDRHHDWHAVCLYCLARYFQRDYPNPIWEHALRAINLYYESLAHSAWLAGNNDHLFWYTSYYEPIFTYLTLSGDRRGFESGYLPKALRTQDILYTGNQPGWGLHASSLGFLHQAAYLTGDGRWLYYGQRTGVKTDRFRIGQSYWPDEKLKPRAPTELLNTWAVQEMPEPMWRKRGKPLPLERAFLWASYRSALDGSGDYTLIKGHNGAGRNPYHTFVILELRLNGHTLLKGYGTQLLTSADGMVEPLVAMDAGLVHHDVIGDTAVAVAEVPRMAFCNWRRTLVQRRERYALIVDDLAFRTDSDNMEIETGWQTVRGTWQPDANKAVIRGSVSRGVRPGWTRVSALDVECTHSLEDPTPESFVKLPAHDEVLLRTSEVGSWLEMPFELAKPVEGEVFVELINDRRRGVVRMTLDGKPVGGDFTHYAASQARVSASLGSHSLTAGEHRLRIESVARRAGDERCWIALSGIAIKPQGARGTDPSTVFELHPADPVRADGSAAITMRWAGKVRNGGRRVALYLLGQTTDGAEGPLACFRVAENAAALGLPEPALVVAGDHADVRADLAVVEGGHLYGRNLLAASVAAPLLLSDVPIDVDWDLDGGVLHVEATENAELRLGLVADAAVRLDGQPVGHVPAGSRLRSVAIAAGRHVLTGARPDAHAREALAASLAALFAKGRAGRAQEPPQAETPSDSPVPDLPVVFNAKVADTEVQDIDVIDGESGPLICATAGRKIHMLDLNGKEMHRAQAESPINLTHWWPEHRLLLAGCSDEKVIAFDEKGQRQWIFASKMDPVAVGKMRSYWNEDGIHGLHTGVFLEGRHQCFVGTSCTLEIIDHQGKLMQRMPIFWGNCSRFALIDGPDDSINLLVGRQPTGHCPLAVINNRDRSLARGFHTVPRGHTYVRGWRRLDRAHIFYEDLDGDGTREVVSEVNGTWNRITVWDRTGKALYNAQFGPGTPGPRSNMRALDIGDLDGDGRKEILVGISRGLVVALDCKCQKIWSRRLNSPPLELKCAAARPWVVVGCEDGTVVALDGTGRIVRQARLSGKPTCSAVTAPIAVLGTAKGEVTAFRIAQ